MMHYMNILCCYCFSFIEIVVYCWACIVVDGWCLIEIGWIRSYGSYSYNFGMVTIISLILEMWR